jgi:uncharacterized membrane protein
MPFTPLHFGPGFVPKVWLKDRYSFITFVTAQVIIDIETAWNMFHHNYPMHTFFHSLGGSIVVIALSFLIAPLANTVLFKLASKFDSKQANLLLSPVISKQVLLGSAAFGAWSHLLLDGLMHTDMSPFAPFTKSNPMLTDDFTVAGNICLGLGVVSAFLFVVYLRILKRKQE